MAPLATYRASVVMAIYNMVAPFATFKLLDLLAAFMGSRCAPSPIKKAYSWLLDLGRRRGRRIRAGDYVALAIFAGVPLPATGAWTASLIAYVLGFERRKAIIAIEIGVLLASAVVFIASYIGIEILLRILLLE